MSSSIVCYKNYDNNRKTVEAFMKLAHQMYQIAYFADVLHVGNAIGNMSDDSACFIAFDLGGHGIYHMIEEYPISNERQITVCKELHRHARGDVYRFDSGQDEPVLIEQYTYR